MALNSSARSAPTLPYFFPAHSYGVDPIAVGVDPTVHRAYVANQGSNNVTVIDTTTNPVVGAPIPVGSQPAGVGIGP